MGAYRPFAGFVIRLLVVYGVFCIPWPGLRQGYAELYQRAGNCLFGSIGSDGVVRFRPAQAGQDEYDSEIQVFKRGRAEFGSTRQNSIRTGYLPMATTVALVLATPIPWRRRWKALLFGVLLVIGFVTLRMYIILLHWFSVEMPWALYKPGPFWNEVLTRVFEFTAIAPTCKFLVPVLIWILVCFRREDARHLFVPTPKTTKQEIS